MVDGLILVEVVHHRGLGPGRIVEDAVERGSGVDPRDLNPFLRVGGRTEWRTVILRETQAGGEHQDGGENRGRQSLLRVIHPLT